jgi:hypothetical protein
MMDKKFRSPEKNNFKFALQKNTNLVGVFLWQKGNFYFAFIQVFVDLNNAMFRNPKLNLLR